MNAPLHGSEVASARATSMDASAQLARHAIPEPDRIELAMIGVLHIAGAAERGELDVEGRPFAEKVFTHMLAKAIDGGFCDGATLACYGKANAYTPTSMKLAANMVNCIGGHDAVLDIFDLHAFNHTGYGALQ
nr:hypothetical protein [uncultured Duganella sp.]